MEESSAIELRFPAPPARALGRSRHTHPKLLHLSSPHPSPTSPTPPNLPHMSKDLSLYKLSQPEKLNDVLAADKEDCLSCRITGASAFLALGAYTYYSGTTQLQARQAEILKSGSRFGMRARGGGVVGLSAVLAGMGLYRLVN